VELDDQFLHMSVSFALLRSLPRILYILFFIAWSRVCHRQHFSFCSPSFCPGKSLYETCEMNGIDLGPASVGGLVEAARSDTWTEPLYGEGPTTGFDHVLLVGNGVDTAAPMTFKEEAALGDYWDEDEIFPESRLATQVTVTKAMEGMTVYVPDRLVDDNP
jgi:hypothetical protein